MEYQLTLSMFKKDYIAQPVERPNPTSITKPEEWVPGMEHCRQAIGTAIEEGVDLDLDPSLHTTSMIYHFFPETSSEGFYIDSTSRPQEPLQATVDTSPSASDTTTSKPLARLEPSVDSRLPPKSDVGAASPESISIDPIGYPAFSRRAVELTIFHDARPSQGKIVAVIEFQASLDISNSSTIRFCDHARRLRRQGSAAAPSAMILVLRGIAFYWWHDEIQSLAGLPCFGNDYLKTRYSRGMCARADSVEFLQALAKIRQDYVDWFQTQP
ncbi:hypothetical protein RhiJN_25387 [Ceratobasidium sp. AG-Ba]|nr:hypothetical protein RhiJN_25387 [Ceratobasidium sp. AG-Ba]